MADMLITLNAWWQEPIKLHAVQGEAESRTLNITGLDASGAPIDLTGASVRIYVRKPSKQSVFADGEVLDAPNGEMRFILTYQMLAEAGMANATILAIWPDNRTLKLAGLALDILQNNLEDAAESTNEFSSLVVALNKADTAATTAAQAAEDAQQALQDAQSAIISTNVATKAANDAAIRANAGADAANQAAQNIGQLYQMTNPLTGQTDYVTYIINDLTTYIFRDAITAQEMDNLDKSAQDFDALNVSARDFDISARTILGVA